MEKFIDTPVKRYSGGMYVRLAFAVGAQRSAEPSGPRLKASLEPESLLAGYAGKAFKSVRG